MTCLLKSKIQKIFLTLRIFLKHEAACIVQHSVYNKLVMHIKMSWMKGIKRLPAVLQKQAMIDNFASSYSPQSRQAHSGHIEACILKAGSQHGVRAGGRGVVGP